MIRRLCRQDGGLRQSLPSGRASRGPGGLESALHLPRPPHPVPTFVTMANAPLSGRDGKIFKSDLGL
jgi:hypothetical protein